MVVAGVSDTGRDNHGQARPRLTTHTHIPLFSTQSLLILSPFQFPSCGMLLVCGLMMKFILYDDFVLTGVSGVLSALAPLQLWTGDSWSGSVFLVPPSPTHPLPLPFFFAPHIPLAPYLFVFALPFTPTHTRCLLCLLRMRRGGRLDERSFCYRLLGSGSSSAWRLGRTMHFTYPARAAAPLYLLPLSYLYLPLRAQRARCALLPPRACAFA